MLFKKANNVPIMNVGVGHAGAPNDNDDMAVKDVLAGDEKGAAMKKDDAPKPQDQAHTKAIPGLRYQFKIAAIARKYRVLLILITHPSSFSLFA